MAKKTPIVRDKIFTLWDFEADRPIMELDITSGRDWPHWQIWLNRETTKSFRYIGGDGSSCSVVKETRLSFGKTPKPFWYAHKRVGKLKRKYLGQSENLTFKRLQAVAFELSRES